MAHSRHQRDQAALIQRRVFIKGRVQGVSFRASTERAAAQFPQMQGFVRNLPDGRVEAVFAGQQEEVLFMVAWCKKGPLLAKVRELEVHEEGYDSNLNLFRIEK